MSANHTMDPSSSSSSSPDTTILTPPETTQIPSFGKHLPPPSVFITTFLLYDILIPPGIEFFEYRRRLFLAGQPLPVIPTNPPSNYTISLPLPEPIPPVPFRPNPSSAVGRLEALLSEEGAEETEAAWKVIEVVHQKLMDRKRLAKPLRLGLVVSHPSCLILFRLVSRIKKG